MTSSKEFILAVAVALEKSKKRVVNDTVTHYVDPEKMSELSYIVLPHTIDGVGTVVKIYRHGEDYDTISEDVNYLGFVAEIEVDEDTVRWIEVSGFFISHDGGYYTSVTEVQPKTVTVKTFE